MLLGQALVALVSKHVDGGDQLAAGESGIDDLVDVPALGGDVRVGELLLVLGDLLLSSERAVWTSSRPRDP